MNNFKLTEDKIAFIESMIKPMECKTIYRQKIFVSIKLYD